MSLLSNLETFIRERVAAWDPSVDTSEGSAFHRAVIKPLQDYFTADPLDMDTDIESFIISSLKNWDSDLYLGEGSAMRDLLITPLKLLLEPLKREIYHSQRIRSLADYASMTNEELDAFASTYFISRRKGAKATTTVRVYFTSPKTVTIFPTARFYTADGLNYYPKDSVTYDSSEMALNVEGSLYYIEVDVEAEKPGVAYRVPRGAIIGIDGFAGYTKVYNPEPVVNGLDEETNEELYNRLRSSLTERSPTTERGIKTVIMENFPYVSKVKVVGTMDPEMTRDMVYVPGGTLTGATGITGETGITGAGEGAWFKTGNKIDIYIGTKDVCVKHVDLAPGGQQSGENIRFQLSFNPTEYGENLIEPPVIRIVEVKELDVSSGAETGVVVPRRDPIDCRALYPFSGGELGSAQAQGTVRIFFEKPTRFELKNTTRFITEEGLVFYPTLQGVFYSELKAGQYIAATELDTNREVFTNINYYYFDVGVKAESQGAIYNVAKDTQFIISDYESEGWTLISSDTSYAFSAREGLILEMSPTYNDGESNTVNSAFRVYYQTSQTIADVQSFVLNDEVRCVVMDPLVKSFLPLFFSAHIRYEGDVEEYNMLTYLQDYILNLQPGSTFVVSDLIHYFHKKGATRIDLPLTIFLIGHNEDRTLKAYKFDDEYDIPKNCEIMIGTLSVEKLA